MRLHEITSNKWYFGTTHRQLPGWLVRGRPERHPDPEGRIVDDILEKYRPRQEMSRDKSLFLSRSPDEETVRRANRYTDYIYEMAPIGEIFQNDHVWWDKIREVSPDLWLDGHREEAIEVAREFAQNYWAGKASEAPQWEYRVRSAAVIRRVNGPN